MEKSKTFREKLIESTVIISAILIFVGFIKQYIYFNYFNIPIHQYLSFDEIIILFLSDITYICKLVILCLLYALLIMGLIKGIDWWRKRRVEKQTTTEDGIIFVKKEFDESQTIENITLKGMDDKKVVTFLIVLSLLLATIFGTIHFFSNSPFIIMFLSLFVGQAVLTFFIRITKNKVSDFGLAIVLLAMFGVLLVCKNKVDISETLDQPNKMIYTIQMTDTTIISNSDLLFLGKTNDYIYFYKPSISESVIYKSDDVKVYTKQIR
jgi:hypothetical protein